MNQKFRKTEYGYIYIIFYIIIYQSFLIVSLLSFSAEFFLSHSNYDHTVNIQLIC